MLNLPLFERDAEAFLRVVGREMLVPTIAPRVEEGHTVLAALAGAVHYQPTHTARYGHVLATTSPT